MPYKTVDQLGDLQGSPSSNYHLIIHDGSDARKVSISNFNTLEGGGNSIRISGSKIEFQGHIIPTQNAQYDLGNAEYKIRHLFLSDNSLWIGDEHKLDISSEGKVQIKKRKKSKIPKSILDLGGDQTEAINSKDGASSLDDLELNDWLEYLKTKSGDPNKTISDLFPKEGSAGYDADDYEDVSRVSGPPKALVLSKTSLPASATDGELALVTDGADGGGKVLAYYHTDGWYRSTDNQKIN